MPAATRTAGPRIRRWAPSVLRHQRSYQTTVKMTTMNRWEAQGRIDVRWTDAERVGKSVINAM